ncbi:MULTISPECIES: CarD family transcriptional regulator [Allobacillus]|uniref:CarD family transcriptional regulator n=1 Tax=Allobacillus halotolerans TaxID=570278 RepID=A0ABS6GLA5_9BACI|nr:MULTISPECIES: CarD family transcriptional regulator [Allobacillus]MBU6079907.1 CarD family transcriptional regulator [Allobacillus halotolerans]TSJ62412.1 CarD family transcriptional regulator [Allobacillus sp. SKP2-8]
MLSIGDLIVYSSHGICRVEDICDQTYGGVTKKYYMLQPVDNDQNLTIHAPVESKQKNMQRIMNRSEAEKVIETFSGEGVEWIERPQQRTRDYKSILNQGDRLEIAKVASTLLRKKQETEEEGRKFSELDGKLLKNIQDILFREVAIVLNKPYEKVVKRIDELVAQ